MNEVCATCAASLLRRVSFAPRYWLDALGRTTCRALTESTDDGVNLIEADYHHLADEPRYGWRDGELTQL